MAPVNTHRALADRVDAVEAELDELRAGDVALQDRMIGRRSR